MNWEAAEKYAAYESRFKVRPNPKANRPRTKQRPDHKDALVGMVTGVDRGRYSVVLDVDLPSERTIVCARARELRSSAIVVGDLVHVVGDTSGTKGTLGRIVKVAERKTVLRRSADDTDRLERVMVANATQMVIVVAAANPQPRVGLVDRSLVAAYDAGIKPIICVTKTDLQDPSSFLTHFAALDIEVVLSGVDSDPATDLGRLLPGNITVFIGHSGVGKSTLINKLVPSASRATGQVNAVTGRGRHTSSSSAVLRYTHAFTADAENKPASEKTGWVIDTPGVRSFGLGHVSAANVIAGFDDLAAITADCPKGCLHSENTAQCALHAAKTNNALTAAQSARLDSLWRLLKTADAPDRR